VFCCTTTLCNPLTPITCSLYSRYCCTRITHCHCYIHVTTDVAIKESKLFVGMLPLRIDETKLTELFQPFGTISEIYVMRDLRGGSKVSLCDISIPTHTCRIPLCICISTCYKVCCVLPCVCYALNVVPATVAHMSVDW
jgi:RNA recognition motif. (a.k.a. RRM, RBD, or RNP domain)